MRVAGCQAGCQVSLLGHGKTRNLLAAQTHAVVRYEEQMAALRGAFTGVFQDLVVSGRSTPFTRRAILPHLPKMAAVLGRR